MQHTSILWYSDITKALTVKESWFKEIIYCELSEQVILCGKKFANYNKTMEKVYRYLENKTYL